jgi:hypothetical protein
MERFTGAMAMKARRPQQHWHRSARLDNPPAGFADFHLADLRGTLHNGYRLANMMSAAVPDVVGSIEPVSSPEAPLERRSSGVLPSVYRTMAKTPCAA